MIGGPQGLTVTEVGPRRPGPPLDDAHESPLGHDGRVPAAMLVPVQLTKQEVFEACQALADADPVLVAAGGVDEARALGDLFELLEDRMTRCCTPVRAEVDRRDG